jgi:hypothetical protein
VSVQVSGDQETRSGHIGGQKVTETYRPPGNAERVRALDAEPVTLDQQPARVWRRTAGSS